MILLVKNTLFPSNTFIVTNEKDVNCIIIDPGLNEEIIDKKIQELSLNPIAIIATHGHFDHIGSTAFFQTKYSIPFYLHQADFKISQSIGFYLKVVGIKHKIITPKPDFLIKGDFEKISIKNFNFEIYSFPSHTAGSVVIKFENNIFSGDIFYTKGLGFNHFPGEDKVKLRNSVLKIFKIFNDDIIVLPGHGESESLSFIKENNLELKDFLLKN